jgi:hypothetical protein
VPATSLHEAAATPGAAPRSQLVGRRMAWAKQEGDCSVPRVQQVAERLFSLLQRPAVVHLEPQVRCRAPGAM